MIKSKINFNMLLIGVFILTVGGSFFYYGASPKKALETSKPTTISETQAAHNEITLPSRKTAKPLRAEDQTKTKKTIPEGKSNCAEACQNRILKKLASGADLTPTEADIIIQNADVFAQRLAAAPPSLARLLIHLQKDEGEQDHIQFAAYAILEALTEEDRAAAGQVLLGHKNPPFRVLGIELSQAGVTHDVNISRALGGLLEEEKSARVLITALGVLNKQKTPGPHVSETITGLNHLINFHKSDHIRGNALVAKARLAPSTKASKADIHRALASDSTDLLTFGLEAFSVARNRHGFQPNNARTWTNDEESIKLLQSIINNPNLDSDLRQLAGELTLLD